MKLVFQFLIVFALFNSCQSHISSKARNENNELIEKISNQLQYSVELNTANKINDSNIFPRSLDDTGELRLVKKKDWTSGFYPGVLWLMHDLTGEKLWKKEATKYTELLESEKLNATTHDLGFKMMSSFGNGYRLEGNAEYKLILIQSAHTLITRFNENVGCIRSWDHNKDKWEYPVIIDNMMNLELLFWAWKETGDPVFYNVALKHAETTMKNHFRSDYSSYHVVSYSPITGTVAAKNTHQGFSDESCWARGQAWALYGFTMVYRETKNRDYLKQAERIANYIINIALLPTDFIPFWDFNAPNIPNEPRDVSAGAVIASALFELSTYSEINKESYLTVANKIIDSLSSDKYFNKEGSSKGFLLKHSVGSKPAESEVDVPLIYADYYYLEALKRKIEINQFK